MFEQDGVDSIILEWVEKDMISIAQRQGKEYLHSVNVCEYGTKIECKRTPICEVGTGYDFRLDIVKMISSGESEMSGTKECLGHVRPARKGQLPKFCGKEINYKITINYSE